jgi:hypothetical protein
MTSRSPSPARRSRAGENLALDLHFNAPSTDFRSILSLVPAVYAHDFDKVKTSGTFTVGGRVQGEYGDAAFPSFALDAKVNDAAFQYPDLPLPARASSWTSRSRNPGGSAGPDRRPRSIAPRAAGAEPGRGARGCCALRVSDPDVDARA